MGFTDHHLDACRCQGHQHPPLPDESRTEIVQQILRSSNEEWQATCSPTLEAEDHRRVQIPIDPAGYKLLNTSSISNSNADSPSPSWHHLLFRSTVPLGSSSTSDMRTPLNVPVIADRSSICVSMGIVEPAATTHGNFFGNLITGLNEYAVSSNRRYCLPSDCTLKPSILWPAASILSMMERCVSSNTYSDGAYVAWDAAGETILVPLISSASSSAS